MYSRLTSKARLWADEQLNKMSWQNGRPEAQPLLPVRMVRSRGTRASLNSQQSAHTSASGFSNGEPVNFDELLGEMTDNDRDLGERLRRHLQFYFMDPMEKWKVRHQFPYKLFIQILKIFFITAQLCLFAEMRMSHVDFMEDTNTVMRHKFLKEWNDDRDALQYPPSEGRYSVYDTQGLFDHLAHIVTSYYSISTDSFASFSYDSHLAMQSAGQRLKGQAVDFAHIPPLKVCIDRLNNVTINNNTYEFDITDVHECLSFNLTQAEVDEIADNSTAVVTAFGRFGVTFLPEDALRISKATFHFNLRTIHFSPRSTDQKPECYLIAVSVAFDNSRHTGQIHVNLATLISYVNECNGRVIKGVALAYDTVIIAALDVFVLLMCSASLVLCARALIKAHLLKNRAVEYFEGTMKVRMSLSDKLDFLNLWYVMIVINDICIITGTLSKISIEFSDFDNDLFTMTGILLGMGALFVYLGVLRYFGFFNQYNILILTIKKSLPSMLRFMTCAIVLYTGFLMAGWVIIGPYSLKFRTLSESSEALFSLLNGDDMFATFYTINDSNTTIKVFGTIYIYCFVSLFIYVVLSLFIAIIMDAYEIVKDRYSAGLTVERSTLKDFVASSPPPELSNPSTQAQFSPSALLNLGTGSDSNSRSSRALRWIDRVRDALRGGSDRTRLVSVPLVYLFTSVHRLFPGLTRSKTP